MEAISKKGPPLEIKYPRDYDQARTRLTADIAALGQQIEAYDSDLILKESVVFCVRLNPKFIAKSYFPANFVSETGLEIIGSRKWKIDDANFSKILFLRGAAKKVKDISAILGKGETTLKDAWKNDCKKIEKIDILKLKEQFLGFENWEKGKVEFVFHPMGAHSEDAYKKLKKRFRDLDVDLSTSKEAIYSNGIRFLSAYCTKKQLNAVGAFNPLRTAHPLNDFEFPNARGATLSDAPQVSLDEQKSVIKVGVFDGGSDPSIPLLANHVNEYAKSPLPPNKGGLQHGSAVAGAVLYGGLNDFDHTQRVPSPRVGVESFRVFPLKTDVYETIDYIEEVVPERPDIKVYNVSYGPPSMIIDDDICRFTFALDKLSFERKVLFVVACGNDGASKYPLNRIQSPSDVINSLGIGAWSHKIDKGNLSRVKAPYSCVGPGREGSKVKPDVVAFGGCPSHPMHLVSTTKDKLIHWWGTSFSAPVVAGLAGEIIGRCDRVTPLSAKALIIHSAKSPNKSQDEEFGFGAISNKIEDVLHDEDSSYTVIYQSSLRPGTFAKLPIPFKDDICTTGKICVKWTVCVLSNPDILNAEEYSTSTLVDTFYPNAHKFAFAKQKPNLKWERRVLDLREESDTAEKMKAQGWKKNVWPESSSGNQFKVKEAEQLKNLKWDTVVKREKSFMAKNVSDPFLVIHSMNRNTESVDNTDYAVVVTVSYTKDVPELQSKIREKFKKLNPLEIKALNQIYVTVK